jgi:hypothetical protein
MYVGYNAYEFINYMSEGKPDENGNRDNITKKLARGIGTMDLGYHKIKDTLGLTDIAKSVASVMPGIDQVGDLPGLNLLKLDKTYEDRVNDFNSGMEPVRKGRYWDLGLCVVPTQLIQNGYGTFVEAQHIMKGEVVITHEGILQPVLNVVTRQMEANEMALEITLHTTSFTNITTDNHPYYAIKKKRCPSSSYDDCRPDRCSTFCLESNYKLCKDRFNFTPQWVLARDLEIGDYLAYPRIKILNVKNNIGNLPANREIGYLLGMFLAEGNIHTWHKNGKTYGIEIALNSNETNMADKIKTILDNYFPNTNTKIQIYTDGTHRLRIRNLSTKVSETIRNILYVNDREKSFIPNIYEYNLDFILGVLEGLFDGDGCVCCDEHDSLTIEYKSARPSYSIQVRNLLFTLGVANSLYKENAKLNGKVFEHYRTSISGDNAIKLRDLLSYSFKCNTENALRAKTHNNAHKFIVVDEEYVYIRIKNITDSGYHGEVYDFEIKDSHSFCSPSAILHNTPFTGGRIEYFHRSG